MKVSGVDCYPMAEVPSIQRTYKVWASDDVIYGPIDFSLLCQWVREARVSQVNWIYTEQTETWSRAEDLAELGLLLKESEELIKPGTINTQIDPLIPGVPMGTLQEVEIFKNMTDRQRGRFAQCMEVQKFSKFDTLVKENASGEDMYVILEGLVRVRKMIGGREDVLATLGAGEMFGEMSLFDSAKRSADIVANSDGVLLRLSKETMQGMVDKQPEVVVPFLVEISKKMAERIRSDNERHKKNTILNECPSFNLNNFNSPGLVKKKTTALVYSRVSFLPPPSPPPRLHTQHS